MSLSKSIDIRYKYKTCGMNTKEMAQLLEHYRLLGYLKYVNTNSFIMAVLPEHKEHNRKIMDKLKERTTMKKLLLIPLVALTILLGGCTWFDDRAKDFESDTKGLKRTVTIYSKTGEVLKQYKGNNVRTKYNDNGGPLVINIDGKRVQLMNSDVVIEEQGAEMFEVTK